LTASPLDVIAGDGAQLVPVVLALRARAVPTAAILEAGLLHRAGVASGEAVFSGPVEAIDWH